MPLALSIIIAAAALFGLWLRLDHPDFAIAAGGAIAFAVFVAPHERHYDQLLLLVPAALAVSRIADLRSRDRVVATAAAMVTLALVPWWLYGIAVARGIPRGVPDLHEEWSALVPLLAFVLVVSVDHLARATSAVAARASNSASPA
jgi:hypothetical protein